MNYTTATQKWGTGTEAYVSCELRLANAARQLHNQTYNQAEIVRFPPFMHRSIGKYPFKLDYVQANRYPIVSV